MADLPHLPRPRPSLKERKTTDRTNEGPRTQRGAFGFRRRGVSIYFLQVSLFRVDSQSVFATLNLKRTHAHRKICLPKPNRHRGNTCKRKYFVVSIVRLSDRTTLAWVCAASSRSRAHLPWVRAHCATRPSEPPLPRARLRRQCPLFLTSLGEPFSPFWSMPPFGPGPLGRTNRIRSLIELAIQMRSGNHYPPQSQSQKPPSYQSFTRNHGIQVELNSMPRHRQQAILLPS